MLHDRLAPCVRLAGVHQRRGHRSRRGGVEEMSASPVQLQGILGAALDANLRGRLSHFIVDETSPAIELFAPEKRRCNHEGDWYGEHAGKWLIAASKAAARSGDAALRQRVLRVADHLVSLQ